MLVCIKRADSRGGLPRGTPEGDSRGGLSYKKNEGAHRTFQELSFVTSSGVQPQKVHSRSFCSNF